MYIIYEPKGKAREYSPLAANLYSGCGHACSYCYVPNVLNIQRNDFDSKAEPRADVLDKLNKDAEKIYNSNTQVLMSFSTDPYNPYEEKYKLTHNALKIFLINKIPVAILTKAGNRCLRDIELFLEFGEHIKIGASLTFYDKEKSKRIEKNAALPSQRIEALKILHDAGIRTWVSLEPIIEPDETLELIKKTIEFVDEYQLGKLSDDKRNINWNYYLGNYVKILRENNKDFYIKKTLQQSAKYVYLKEEEINMDRLTLKPFPKAKEQLLLINN